MSLDKKYKFKDLKVYASAEWLADGNKKYRTVFENAETSYLYAELSFHNKLFDSRGWTAKIKLKAFRIKEKNVREELCSIDLDHYVSKEDDVVLIREGWGNKEVGVFWTRGDYVWEAYIGADLVGTKIFYIENGGPVLSTDNPYFDIDSIKLYEGPNKGVPSVERTYLTHFNAKDTRYVWAEFNINNMQATSWYCELFFHFYNNTGQLKGRTTEVKKINPDDDLVTITTGWGSDSKGTWYEDTYTLQVIFMNHLVAVITFKADIQIKEGINKFLTGSINKLVEKVQDLEKEIKIIPQKKRRDIFISYSHHAEEKPYFDEVKRQLQTLKAYGLIDVHIWEDTQIRSGDDWLKEIKTALSKTKIGVLLVSPNFLASKFIGEKEIPALLETIQKENGKIMSLIVRRTLFEKHPILSKYQSVNQPNKPLNTLLESEKDEVYVKLLEDILHFYETSIS
jgi:hypothetical protein